MEQLRQSKYFIYMSITFQTKQTCIIIENIREPAKATGVDIRTLGNSLGPHGNTSHDVRNNYNSRNNLFTSVLQLEIKPTCIIIENIREPAKATGVDIQTLRNGLGPHGKISHDVRNNYDSQNILFT